MFAELNKPCRVDRACECCYCHQNPFADPTPNPNANSVLTGVVVSEQESIMLMRLRISKKSYCRLVLSPSGKTLGVLYLVWFGIGPVCQERFLN